MSRPLKERVEEYPVKKSLDLPEIDTALLISAFLCTTVSCRFLCLMADSVCHKNSRIGLNLSYIAIPWRERGAIIC